MATVSSVIIFITGILVGVATDLLKDKISRQITAWLVTRAKARYSKSAVPVPSPYFRSFRFGNLEIPVMSVFGSPQTPFQPHEVRIEFKPVFMEDSPNYPLELKLRVTTSLSNTKKNMTLEILLLRTSCHESTM